MRHRLWPMLAVAGLAAPVLAGGGAPTAVLEIGPNSSATLTVSTSTFVGSDTDTDTVMGVSGQITLSATDFSNPVDLQLEDLTITLDPAAATSSFIDGGPFLGSAGPITLALEGIDLDTKGNPKGLEGGLAGFQIPVLLTGEASATYDLIGIAPADNEIIDLSTVSPTNAQLDILSLSSNAGELTLEAVLSLEAVLIPYEPGLVEVTIADSTQVNIQATGDDPGFEPDGFCSRADIAAPCGTLDLNDIVAFVQGFSAQDPISDINGDTVFDLNDIVAFVTAFQGDVCDPNGQYYCYGYGNGLVAIEFHEGNAAYAFGDHSALTAGIAVAGAALMLGFGSFRRKHT